MKNILNKKTLAAALALGTLSLTGCIEETVPLGSTATAEQLAASAKATEALLAAPAAFTNNFGTYNSDYGFDWGYGALMHARDVMTGDMIVCSSGYNWFTYWSENIKQAEDSPITSFVNMYYSKAIQTANNILKAIDIETANDAQKGLFAVGSAWRAVFYLDAARMFEFLPNDVTDSITKAGNNISHLTMPIVTEKTTEQDARNNPRATREQMAAFIENDLNQAEKYMPFLDEGLVNRTSPSTLGVVYGLKARLYMWVEQYDSAAVYASKAINFADPATGIEYVPMDDDEMLNTATGFNTIVDSWMLASQQTAEDRTVTSGILNWTSWLSNETTYGYAVAEPYVMIASDLYDKIGAADVRKLLFKAPKTSPLSGTEPTISKTLYNEMPVYGSLKFRPGEGNPDNYQVGSATAYPMMRVEEMYFIMAEAVAHSNPAQGKTMLESFMKQFRNPEYTCRAASQDDIIREIVTQKSIELFGEGQSYFDIKRLNYSVDRTLAKNANTSERFKTNGRPAWMNLCLMYRERVNNPAIDGYQSPDPSGAYKAITAK